SDRHPLGSLQGMGLRVRVAILHPACPDPPRRSHLRSNPDAPALEVSDMNRRIGTLATALIIMTLSHLTAQQPSPLAAAYPIKVGDMVAQTLSEFLKIRTDFKD